MRYGRDRKQATRRRIIEAAGRRFKADSIDGGDRRAHGGCGTDQRCVLPPFRLKDDLVASAVADQLREQCEMLGAAAPDHAVVEEILRAYLSVRHRDSPEHGCPSASLLDEIARCADATRRAYTDEVLTVIDDAAARVVPHEPGSARVQAFSTYALMVRTLQLSRALMDQQHADVVLEQGIQSALTLLGTEDLR